HDDPRPQHAGGLAVDRVLGGAADQPARVAHLVHDVVAGVDAGTAGDALVLQAVADVDAGRTDLHADGAVDAVAQFLELELRQRLRLAGVAVPGDRAGGVRGLGRRGRVAAGAEHVIIGGARIEQADGPRGSPRIGS